MPGPDGQNPLVAGARRRREVFPSRQAAFDYYASKPPFSVLSREGLSAYVDYGFDDLDDGTVRLKCRGEDEARTYESSSPAGAFDRLGEITCPVTLACGELSDVIGPTSIEAQAAPLRHASTVVLPGLSHFGPLEHPEALADAIAGAFLAEG
jgi:pimeloyl-ACP methyl ester carboxylesterase